jgi:prepilin-type N-terminal cleavage/methylation domain-containing protein
MVPTGRPKGYGRGVTLVELLVVLVIVGVMFGVTGLALASLHVPQLTMRVRLLREARVRAIQTGVPVRMTIDTPERGTSHRRDSPSVLFLPDGRAVGPGVDPLTGAPANATR